MKKFCLMLATFLICLAVAEAAVRLWVPVRSVGPVATTYDPVYGKSLKKSYSCRRISPEFTYRLTTNSLGFRGPEPASPQRGAVVFLGDSMTMGSSVNDGEEFPALVRQRLATRFGEGSVPVVNAAVAHSGNGRWIKFLRADAEQFDPRFVFLQFHGNDFRENAEERLFDLDESGELRELPVPPPGALRRLQGIVEAIPGVQYSYLMAITRQAVRRIFMPNLEAETEGQAARREQLAYRLVEEALKICQQHGWPVIGITVWVDDHRRERLHAIFQQYGAPVIDMSSVSERPDLYWKIDPHWHAEGNAWVAEVVYERLVADPRFETGAKGTGP